MLVMCNLFYLCIQCLYLLVLYLSFLCFFFFFKQKTAYEMRISDWSSDVCSSDLLPAASSRQPLVARSRRWTRKIFLPNCSRSRSAAKSQIGRASCRERVCQYV